MNRWLKVFALAVTLVLAHFTMADAYFPYGTCVISCDEGTFATYNVTMNQCCSGQFHCPAGGPTLDSYWVPSYPADVVWCP